MEKIGARHAALTNATRLRYPRWMDALHHHPKTLLFRSSYLQSLVGALDKIGALTSSACAVHCILLPFVLTFLPLFGLGFFATSAYEIGFIGFSLMLAAVSFALGCRIHGKIHAIACLMAAMLCFGLAHSFVGDPAADNHENFELFHASLMSLGGALIALGHLFNRKLCKSCDSCSGH